MTTSAPVVRPRRARGGILAVMTMWYVATFVFVVGVTSLAMVFMTMTFEKIGGKGAL